MEKRRAGAWFKFFPSLRTSLDFFSLERLFPQICWRKSFPRQREDARARRHSMNGDDSANKKLSWSESFEETQQTSYGGKNSLIVGMNIFHFTLLLKYGITKLNFFCSWVVEFPVVHDIRKLQLFEMFSNQKSFPPFALSYLKKNDFIRNIFFKIQLDAEQKNFFRIHRTCETDGVVMWRTV